MYNTKHKCMYNSNDLLLNIENYDENYTRDFFYKADLLSIFEMEEFDENIINIKINKLYEKIKYVKELSECIMKLSNKYFSTDNILGFMMLYSYDYMHLTHLCVSDYLENGEINETNLFNLKSILI